MIQIQLRPEIESQLATEAQARGVALDRYIEEIVEARSAATVDADEDQRRAVEEMLAFRHEYKATLGGLKLTDLIHEGHRS
jgi:hypothetical protein